MLKRVRNMAVAAGCLLGLAACQNEETVPTYDAGERILFGMPTMTVETQGRSTLKDALAAGDEFGVIGYCLAYTVGTQNIDYNSGSSSWSVKRNLCPPSVFYGQRVTVGTSGCTYDQNGGTDNNPKYWYRDGYGLDNASNPGVVGADNYQYSFYAYYPYEDFTIEAPANANMAGAPVLTFTMPQEGDAEDSSLDHADTPDAMLGVLYNRQREGGNLQFNFSHMLTGLRFVVNNYSEQNLRIYSIKLRGSFFKKVRVNFTDATVAYDFPADRYSGTYTLYDGGEEGFLLEGTGNEEVGTSSDDVLEKEYLMLISGENSYFGENVEVVLDYEFGGVRNPNYTASRPGTFTPRPGVRYTAQLNFVGDAFVLQFVVASDEQWEDGEAADGDEGNDDVLFE